MSINKLYKLVPNGLGTDTSRIDTFVTIQYDEYVSLQNEIKRLQQGIMTALNTTHDDDTHEFLDRLLKGEENNAPDYRIKVGE